MLDFYLSVAGVVTYYYRENQTVRACVSCFLEFRRVRALAVEILKFRSQKIIVAQKRFIFTLEFICIPIFLFLKCDVSFLCP